MSWWRNKDEYFPAKRRGWRGQAGAWGGDGVPSKLADCRQARRNAARVQARKEGKRREWQKYLPEREMKQMPEPVTKKQMLDAKGSGV